MGRAIVVGDPNQSLYAFRGADSQAFQRLREMLGSGGRKLTECNLPINYRCDRAIIQNAQRWVPEIRGHNTAIGTVGTINFYEAMDRANNDGRDIEWPDGDVVPGTADSPDGPRWQVRSLPLPGKEDKGVSFAFLCRINVPLVITAYQLIARKKRVCIIGRNQIGQPLIDLIEALCGAQPGDDGYTNRISNRLDGRGVVVEEGLLSRLSNYLQMQRQKLAEEGYENKLEQVEQNVECIRVIAENVTDDRVSSIIDQIKTLFVEEPLPNVIQLSTVHRSKGLEFDVVFILKPDLMPLPRAKRPEDVQQELNACYVACTRARHRLYYVENWPFGNAQAALNWDGLPEDLEQIWNLQNSQAVKPQPSLRQDDVVPPLAPKSSPPQPNQEFLDDGRPF